MSAKPKAFRPLSTLQFWSLMAVVAIAGVLALLSLANVAGKHGSCPSDTQTSRPAAARCFSAYTNGTGVVGTGVLGASTSPAS